MQDAIDEDEMHYFNVRTANLITMPTMTPADNATVYVDIPNILMRLSDYEPIVVDPSLNFIVEYANTTTGFPAIHSVDTDTE
jgi:hypothetical protein